MADEAKLPVGRTMTHPILTLALNTEQLRLYVMANAARDDYWGSEIPRLENYGPQGRLDVRSVKLYADGMP